MSEYQKAKVWVISAPALANSIAKFYPLNVYHKIQLILKSRS